MIIKIQPDTQNEHLNATEIVLDPKHPGLNDKQYVARRTELFHLARDYRLHNKGIPIVDYTSQENEIWRYISEKLISSHLKKACDIYLTGKELVNLDTQKMPQLHNLQKQLQAKHHIGIVPAEGLLHGRTFHHYLRQRAMPATLFIRHHGDPEYTPEPDAVHDVLGHVPPLMNTEYVDIIQLIGRAVQTANEEELIAWSRVYWFTIEFGLIKEHNELKVFGAGLLSSFGEMDYCFSDNVERRPFSLDEVITTDYDTSRMQHIIFVIPSLDALKAAVLELMARFKK